MNVRFIILTCMLGCAAYGSQGQVPVTGRDSIIFGVPLPGHLRDSSFRMGDSLGIRQWLKRQRTIVASKPGKSDERGRSRLSFDGGFVYYSSNYRSALDTPYTEKNLTQHQVQSTLYFTMAGIPIRVNSFIRRGNSAIFRDITDVQVAFDAAGYRSRLAAMMKERALRNGPSPDSLAARLYALRRGQLNNLSGWLRDPLTKQKLIEANEVIRVPKLTYDMRLPDSVNTKRADSIRKEASRFLDAYKQVNALYARWSGQADTLKGIYDSSMERVTKYRQAAGGSFSNPRSFDQWRSKLKDQAPGVDAIPAGPSWLLGVRSFGLGKNNINTSELTAKNLSLNGVHFEYNSWYYLGLTAGWVDYRFRDFLVHKVQQPKQYMYMMRAGLGRLEKNYFIVSVFGGQKQLLNSVNSAGISPTVRMTGLSAESKWQLQRNTWIIAEAAQSFSPALPGSDLSAKPGWDLSDKSNKALSIKLSSYIPATGSRLEGQYKFMGANYQSFSSFQTSSQQRSWYVKGEQSFFRRELKLAASLRSNDFSNPYIVQNYSSNTVFKSVNLTYHKRGLPTITAGYMPMSQLTKVGDQVAESRFQTLNVGVSHFYKLGLRQAATNIMYTKFFNGSSDSAFIYYNSVNLYAGQTIFFRDFTATLALSHSSSTGYRYNVLDGNISLPLTKTISLGMGAKLNQLDESLTGVGGFLHGNMAISPRDRLTVQLEKGYLPGSGGTAKLVPNVTGLIGYMKIF